jgi:hypothetical protein
MSPNIIERICTKSGCYQRNVQQKALPANKQDSNYRAFYSEKRPLLILHSFGCARDSADVQVARWNSPLPTPLLTPERATQTNLFPGISGAGTPERPGTTSQSG